MESQMALPNYSPSGKILFGSVPWDNSYAHVRLYSSLSEQQSDIASLMTRTSDSYVYIGRERRLKVSLCADELYHCNYCMYRNESVTDGWIYCFVSEVTYVNDHTTEVTLETDVFNTYLYGVDWTVPACFIERETVPSESTDYLLTPEPDFSLIYEVDGQTHDMFELGGFVVATSADPEENSNLIEDILNPSGYYAAPVSIVARNGIVQGCQYYFTSAQGYTPITEGVQNILNPLMQAGSIESVVAVFSIPKFAAQSIGQDGWVETSTGQRGPTEYEDSFTAPGRGTSLNGYTPRNSKLLYYPYTFCRLTDHNGSTSDLRYEQMGLNNQINVKYTVSPTCQALVYPAMYAGANGWEVGIVTQCGALGSWSNSAYQTWLAQNGGMVALTIAGIAFAALSGGTTLSAASKALVPVEAGSPVMVQRGIQGALATGAGKSAMRSLAGAGAAAGLGYQQLTSAMHQPTVTRGQSNLDLMFGTGVQGVSAYRMVCRAEIAQKIDEFFDRWGYAVESIEQPNITSRPNWNYVKTQGCAAKSLNLSAGTSAPFSRGRGTPADALDVIRRAFDSGVTFWHTTENFGNFALSNGVSD